jgi:hypothetical protein
MVFVACPVELECCAAAPKIAHLSTAVYRLGRRLAEQLPSPIEVGPPSGNLKRFIA